MLIATMDINIIATMVITIVTIVSIDFDDYKNGDYIIINYPS